MGNNEINFAVSIAGEVSSIFVLKVFDVSETYVRAFQSYIFSLSEKYLGLLSHPYKGLLLEFLQSKSLF